MFASVCESTWLTINQQGNNNSDWILGDWFFWFVCSLFPLVGLITSVMRVSAFSWMLWRSSWTRSSEWSSVTSNHCAFFFFFYRTTFCSCNHNVLLLCFLFFRQENIDKRNQHKLIQCLKAFMNNKVCMSERWHATYWLYIELHINGSRGSRACNYLALMLCLRSQVNDSVTSRKLDNRLVITRKKKGCFLSLVIISYLGSIIDFLLILDDLM